MIYQTGEHCSPLHFQKVIIAHAVATKKGSLVQRELSANGEERERTTMKLTKIFKGIEGLQIAFFQVRG